MKNWITKSLYKSAALFVLCMLPLGFPVYGESFVTMEELFDEGIEQTAPAVLDPFEPVNRVIFKFNDFLYLNVFDPVLSGYQYIAPDAVEKRLSNFFKNIKYPVRLTGNLLQGKVEGALMESGMFLLNTTVGLGGLNRPSDEIQEMKSLPEEDIGQALGSWGVGNGPYLVLPLLGPSSCRDLLGRFGDRIVDPFKTPYTVLDDTESRVAFRAGGILADPSLVLRYQQMKGTALDPYISLRNGYFQYRAAAVAE